MTIEVRPWATYNEHGQGPFWELRLESVRFCGWVAWASHLGRFVESNELSRLRNCNSRLAYAAAAFMANFDLKAGHSNRDTNQPKRDIQAGQSTGTDRDTSRAQESLRLTVPLSRSGHNERDGTENRDSSIGTLPQTGSADADPSGQGAKA